MIARYCFSKRLFLFVILTIISFNPVLSDTLTHTTRTDFETGSFFNTVLQGTEDNPEISIGTYHFLDWTFEDYNISGWTYDTNEAGNIAEEDPDGQIHLAAQFVGSESGSWSYAARSDIAIPDSCSIEFMIYFDAIDSSGVADPMVEQPTGASCRLDILRTDLGFRMDIFRDRMVSFYREGTTGNNYPIINYFDISTETGQWYTIRLECDFTDSSLPVQIYRDDVWIGELNGDIRNAVSERKIRPLAFSRVSESGLAEFHVDHIRLASLDSASYSTGTYTSEVIDLQAVELDTIRWTEVPPTPYPWQGWVKYEGNPITGPGSLPENILVNIDDPLQQPIQYDGKYWLCYSSGSIQTIRLAYSTDPELLIWNDYESNPVISPIAGEDYVFSPNLFLDDGTYYMVYDVRLSSDHKQRVAYATAPAPTGPWTRGSIILELGSSGQWDDLRVTEPFVFREGDTYFMYYMGDHGCLGCAEQIGLATTTGELFPLGPEAGGLWTKHGLVLPHDPDPEGWDSGLTADPSIIKVDDIYYMRYTGSYANEHWELGCSWATDPYGPWHRPDRPEIERGPSGSWDDDKLVRGAIHYHNEKWYSPYTGSSGSGDWLNYQGGMAVSDPASRDDSLVVETRVSPDGISWEVWKSAENGGPVQSAPDRYFQYRVNFALGSSGNSPTLTEVSMTYQQGITSAEDQALLPVRMHPPHPNPFNPRTEIEFTLDRSRQVKLSIYDVRGARVAVLADRVFIGGNNRVIWNGNSGEGETVVSGVYFIRMETGDFSRTRRIVLLR
ncbi:MAG: T9SS type A sorting domain-containing protein [Candidatus Krumholzibacteriota bacterium]